MGQTDVQINGWTEFTTANAMPHYVTQPKTSPHADYWYLSQI